MDVGQIAKRLLGNPDSAQEVLSLVSRDLGDDAARWISFSRELSASLVVGGESRAIHALGYILAAVIATSESPRGPLEVLVRVAGAVLKSLPFGLGFPSTRHTQSAQRRRQEQMDMYSSLLTIVAKAQAVAPQLFLSLSFSGLSLDFVLSVLLGLAFLTRRAISPGSTQEDTPKAVQLLASCERIETDLLRSLCLNNPRLALCPWALILTQLSNLFHPDPKGDGLPIQSTYDVCSFPHYD